MNKHKIIIITGVAGSGKTTVGQHLARRLQTSFHDGDEFHPPSNVAKMSAGIPLDDADRLPWLRTISAFVREHVKSGTVIVSCSALKQHYRDILTESLDPQDVLWVHLQGSYDLIHRRMSERPGHFMRAEMLQSQFAAYETPKTGLVMSVDQDIEQIISKIISVLESSGSDVGLVGLGVMGTSLARNIARNGYSISLFNRHVAGKEEGVAASRVATYAELNQARPFEDLGDFVLSLSTPRKIILMVNAGAAVDDVIGQIAPLLSSGDVLVDGGNSLYQHTNQRQKKLAEQGIHYVGAGVSGGEEGALLGPSIMPGCSREAYGLVSDILASIAARNELNEVCCDYIGEGGAGHFVKMVHNGIEYAEMQLIAEIYSHLRFDQLTSTTDIADIFDDWNRGEAASYLLGITADILRFNDVDGIPLIDKIQDVAGNKGTGGWSTVAACEIGVPVSAMAEALFSRYQSSFKKERESLASQYSFPEVPVRTEISSLLHTYMFCRIINHYQGFTLISQASDEYGWNINTEVLLRIWSGGCIIRSALLARLRDRWKDHGSDVLKHPYVSSLIHTHFANIRETVSKLSLSKQPYPVTSSCLEHFKYMIAPWSNANIIQAQRDYFGAHTYQRIDDPSGKQHHTKWF